MIARLLYAAVALCLLGTRPLHAETRAAPSVDAASPVSERRDERSAREAPSIVAGTPADFAIPRIRR
jgi:hypothetical protein